MELRWYIELEDNYIRGRRAGKKEVEPVLQYRTKDVHVESSTTTPLPPAWSEWTDVPYVVEGK